MSARHWPAGLLLLLLSLLGACSQEPAQPPLRRLSPSAVILAFGDSLTYGTGASPQQAYPARLAALTGRRVINAGVPGETSSEGAERLPGVLAEHRPDLVILCLGGNDFLRKLSRETLQEQLDDMIRQVREQGADLLLVGVPERLTGLRSEPLYAGLAQRHGLALEDRALPEILGQRRLKSDLVHPSAEGYAALAQALHQRLRAHGAL